MRQARGFTIVETVLVVFVLWVLGLVATPKIQQLQEEAKVLSLNSVKAGLEATVAMVYHQSVIQGTDKVYGAQTLVNGVSIQTFYGKPHETWQGKLEHLMIHNLDFMGNAYEDSSLLSQACEKSICVIEQVKLDRIVPYASGYGLVILPYGKSLQDRCLVAYHFYASDKSNEGSYSMVTSTTNGCRTAHLK